MEIALKYKVKQTKNGRFPSNYKASQIDFEMQISLCILAPPKISPPQKRAFEKYKPQGLFSEFYGISKSKRITAIIAQSPLLGFQTPMANADPFKNLPEQTIYFNACRMLKITLYGCLLLNLQHLKYDLHL